MYENGLIKPRLVINVTYGTLVGIYLTSALALRGGVQGNIFGRISFELWAPQVPLMIGETFGEVPGPRRPTVSEPRPAQKLGVKKSFPPDGPRGGNGAPNCSSHHPDSSHIGSDGSRTNGMAVAAQYVPAQFRRESLK